MNTRRISSTIALLGTVLLGNGCGSEGPVTIPIRGEVFYKGAPLKDVPQGMVRYFPKSSEGKQATGRIQPDGTFVLTSFKNADGVMPGEYDVTVSAYTTQPELTREQVEASRGVGIAKPRLIIPERYIDPKASGISDSVNADHSGFKRIELTD